MSNIVHLPTDCPCCALQEAILDVMADSGLPLEEFLFVLDVSKKNAMALCALKDDDGPDDAA